MVFEHPKRKHNRITACQTELICNKLICINKIVVVAMNKKAQLHHPGN